MAPEAPPAWFFELEKYSAAVGLLRLPAGGGTSWYTAHFVSLIVSTAAFAALYQRKVAVSRAQAARKAEEEDGDFVAAEDGISDGASRGPSVGSLAGPPKAASDEAVAVGAFGAAGLSAAWGRGHAVAAGGGSAQSRTGRSVGRAASRPGRAAAGARSTRISVRVRTRRVPRPILDCCGAVCEASLPDHLAGRATGAWGARALRRARREEARSGPMLPDEEGHICATVCGCICTPCPANRPGPSCASRVLASLVSLMRGQLGMSFVLASILAWITTFPDAVSLAYAVAVVGVFVLARGSHGTTAASPLIASSVRAFAAVHSLYLLGFHASCAVAPFFAPAPFIAASRCSSASSQGSTPPSAWPLASGFSCVLLFTARRPQCRPRPPW